MISNYMMGIKPQTSCTFINFPSVNLNDRPIALISTVKNTDHGLIYM